MPLAPLRPALGHGRPSPRAWIEGQNDPFSALNGAVIMLTAIVLSIALLSIMVVLVDGDPG